MNEREALNLVEDFPNWIRESEDKGKESFPSAYFWGAIKAEIFVSKIQWFIHVLYLKGYEIRKKKK